MSRKLVIKLWNKDKEYYKSTKKLHDKDAPKEMIYYMGEEKEYYKLLQTVIKSIQVDIETNKLPHLNLIILDSWLYSVLSDKKKSFYIPKNHVKWRIEELVKEFQKILERNLVSWSIFDK